MALYGNPIASFSQRRGSYGRVSLCNRSHNVDTSRGAAGIRARRCNPIDPSDLPVDRSVVVVAPSLATPINVSPYKERRSPIIRV